MAHSIYGEIKRESAKTLLKRGSRPSKTPEIENGVIFTRDIRLRAILFQRMDSGSLLHFVRKMSCELLIIKAKMSGVQMDTPDITEGFLESYRNTCRRFQYLEIEGQHHVHLCEANVVAPLIVEFVNASPPEEGVNGLTNGESHLWRL